MATSSEVPTNEIGWTRSAQSFWNLSFYNEMRQKAAVLLRNEDPADHLQPEDLVHDAYVRLARSSAALCANDIDHYLAIAVRIMKHSLVDRARASRAHKRFGKLRRTILNPETAPAMSQATQSLWVSELLDKCAGTDRRRTAVVRMRFIEQRPLDEIAAILGVCARTVKRDLRAATFHLRREFGLRERHSRFVR